jgi:L-ascorbate metabolism protein UlaG (beta-lactamase superfamily)
MRIEKFLHSCLLVEKGNDRILFDPGKFSFVDGGAQASDFMNLKAVIITHSHPDHMDDEAIKVIMENNPDAVLYGNVGIATGLQPKGRKVELFEEGTKMIGAFKIDAYEARHERIVAAKIPPNTAYVVDDTLLNPGDSYAYSLDALRGKFDVLALPVMAPWCTEMDSVGFAARMNAKHLLPIHDGYVKDFFLRMRYDNYENHFGGQGVKFERLDRVGAGVDLTD